MAMANKTVTGTCTARGLFRDKYFLRGYADFVRDAGWNTEYENWYQGHQQQYERGRQYAAATGNALPPKIKTRYGKTILNTDAMHTFLDLYNSNYIL
jgi:hypothetical protein